MSNHLLKQINDWGCALRYRRWIVQALDAELPDLAQRELDDHLQSCTGCRVAYERQRFAAELMSLYALPDQSPTGKPEWSAQETVARPRKHWSWQPAIPVAVATVILLIVAGSLWRYFSSPPVRWEVMRLLGNPTVNQRPIERAAAIAPGEWLETDGESRAVLEVGALGQVEVDPNTRLRFLKADASNHRLALQRGKIYATILAPPRLFSVETPAALAVDYGCAYSLEVDDAGDSFLRVTSGWVALQLTGREVLIPAGGMCLSKPGLGIGSPFFEGATKAFRSALIKFDFENGGASALSVILPEARSRDALTLWHLLARVSGKDRIAVYERLAGFSPLPDGASREGILNLDEAMMASWREKLEYLSIGVAPAKAPAATGTLKAVGVMKDARFNHTATLLGDGRVLVAGGRERAGNILASAEIYDPTTGQFTETGQMTTPRVGHTATLLPNGKVLIAGGSDEEFFSGALASAEIFDPSISAFTPVGQMSVPRLAHAAVLLQDGRVLLTGGQGRERENHDLAELYNFRTNAFTPAGTMTEKRADHTATLLTDGRILITGGGRQPQTDVTATAEIYDPKTGRFIPVGSMSVMRYKHCAEILPDGKVIVIGGSNRYMWAGRYASAEIFDPATGVFAATGELNTARYKIRDAVVVLGNGQILVAGGGPVEVYDPKTGLFSAVKGGTATTRYYATATRLMNGDVLIVGGYSSESSGKMPANASAWLYQP